MAKQLDYHTIREIFTRFREADPEPIGELDHVNAYTLVGAVALSAQATDAGVNKATAKLFKIADTPQKMLDLGEEAVIEHIKTIGLYRNKAKNVMKLSRILVDEYGGEVPCSRAALESLPGVGRKTAPSPAFLTCNDDSLLSAGIGPPSGPPYTVRHSEPL